MKTGANLLPSYRFAPVLYRYSRFTVYIGTANEIQKVNDALRNARFENITNTISELDTAKGILSSITSLIQDEWLYDQGELSEYGQAKVALLVSQLEDAQKKANAYLDLYNEI